MAFRFLACLVIALVASSAAALHATISANGYVSSDLASTSFGVSSTLTFIGANSSDTYTTASVEALFNSSTFVRLRVTPQPSASQAAPYILPEVVLPGSRSPASATPKAAAPRYRIEIAADSNAIQVVDSVTGGRLVELGKLVLREKFISFTTRYDNPASVKLYGYGEHDYFYFINKVDNVTLSLWNTDNGTPWKNPMYGVHPVLFFSDPSTSRHFAFMLANSHAQNIHIENGEITMLALGGIIDLYVFVADTPLDVIKQYHKVLGSASVPPYWALGTHQCRWGYRNLSMLEGVVEGYKDHGIPLETIWTDIDYMENYRIFTTDPIRYPEGPFRTFVDALHAADQHIVQIVDPGVAQQNYSVYLSGLANDAFVKIFGKTLINVVWPGWTAFPDFTNESAALWWGQQLEGYLSRIPLDGVWLDMNELGTFCAGYCNVSLGTPFDVDWKTLNWATFTDNICIPNNCSVVPSEDNYPALDPLYNGYNLYNKTLDMTASLALGSYYQTKAFYGQMEERATYNALLSQKGTRPFLLSRASFVGSGRYTAHWTGDNNAAWDREQGGIQDSVQAVLGANLWNIPVVGADIGGFGGPATTEELIVRWYQLGAFYTFMRNHRDLQGPAQEPYLFSQAAQNTMKQAIFRRYLLLPYFFTNLLQASLEGGPVLRHMSLVFPSFSQAYRDSFQFMVGDALMVSPVLVEGATSTSTLFPAGPWYDLWLGTYSTSDNGFIIAASSPLYSPIPVYLRGGFAVPIHGAALMTVKATRATGVGLICGLDGQGSALGSFWTDDGADGPIDTTDRRSISCQTTDVGGIVTSVISNANGASVQPRVPLTNSVQVIVYAPASFASAINFTLNGEQMNLAYVVRGNVLNVTLPIGVDVISTFALEWTVAGQTPPQEGHDNSGDKSASKTVVALLAVSCCLLAAAFIGLVFYRQKYSRRNDSALLDSK